MATREEHDTRQKFGDRYAEDRTDVVRHIERLSWCRLGSHGYTTVNGDLLAECCISGRGATPRSGSGCGWPGLYLA